MPRLVLLAPALESRSRYFEPFLGAGSMFFALNPGRATIGDSNRELILCYRHIRRAPETVWRNLREVQRHRSARSYYALRDEFNLGSDGPRRAALFIYLNRTCFNGIWRVNTEGVFNVPYGKKKNPLFPTLEGLRSIATRLGKAKLVIGHYERTVSDAKAGDFVYLDPPFPPLNGTAFFTHYTKERFDIEDQVRLAQVFKQLAARDCRVLMSNADLPLIRQLYSRFRLTTVATCRTVASGGNRYRVRDLAISNY